MNLPLTALDIARVAWGDPLPDWVDVLVRKCLDMPQARVAERIGYSPAVVSQLLRKRYSGNLIAIEDAVRRVWMDGKVTCPVVGPMSSPICQEWQQKSKEFKATSSLRARMFWACAECPINHFRKENTQ